MIIIKQFDDFLNIKLADIVPKSINSQYLVVNYQIMGIFSFNILQDAYIF